MKEILIDYAKTLNRPILWAVAFTLALIYEGLRWIL